MDKFDGRITKGQTKLHDSHVHTWEAFKRKKILWPKWQKKRYVSGKAGKYFSERLE